MPRSLISSNFFAMCYNKWKTRSTFHATEEIGDLSTYVMVSTKQHEEDAHSGRK